MKKILGFIMILFTAVVLATPATVSHSATKTMPITLPVLNVTSKSDLDKKIKAGEDGKSVTYLKDSPKVFKAEVKEDGILYFKVSSTPLAVSVCDGFNVSLFSNQACTNPIGEEVLVLESSPEVMAFQLSKGTYWLKATPHIIAFTELNTKLTIYTGLVPNKYILDIYKSTNNKAQKVILYVKPFKGYTKLQIRNENVNAKELDGSVQSNSIWDGAGIDFANEQYEVTENGIYTFRIVDADGNNFFKKIKITNIDRTAPKKPTVKAYVKNTTAVTGRGEKGATAYVKTSSKTYKAKVDKKGAFTVKTAKLAKGNTLKIYLKDTAGNTSETVTVKVK